MRYALVILLVIVSWLGYGQSHPSLIMTVDGVSSIRENLGKAPLFDATLAQVIRDVDGAIARGIDVPIPKDLAGGYTHEQHKDNFFILQKAGALYQITQDEKYAIYVRDVLLAYKEMYPKLDRHPAERSYARGKLFWQCLNDANWLVYVSQAYDCIYDWLSPKERKSFNKELFRPMADFLSVETPQFFNRIHNHSTWGNAAVGMIGLVMEDDELVQRALYGAKDVDLKSSAVDNDGGTITTEGEMGFLSQIDNAFSPDGYYTEGPYYQRYAMYPFLIFAESLENKKPDLKIFEYNNAVLLKGVAALLNQTNKAGEFFPINDSQKGMSYMSRELITAVSMAYYYGDQNPTLLSVIKEQGVVSLDQTGMLSAKDLAEGKAQPFVMKSIELRDGGKGDEGAIGILRGRNNPEDELTVLMKYSKHGMGHGHFDKLSFLAYFNEKELFQDYGAARWVNIEQKDGGGYLKENHSWAKHTIAHNTLVLDQKSQFDGKVKPADLNHPDPYLFDTSDPNVQVMSAVDSNSYAGSKMQRTMVMIKNSMFDHPLLLDLFTITSDKSHSYELPYYYKGELMQTSFVKNPETTLSTMGEGFGYQHLWKVATGDATGEVTQVNWFDKEVFYTLTAAAEKGDSYTFGRIGANDPNFNLRRDPVFIINRSGEENELFASVLEVHGSYSYVTEKPVNPYGIIKRVEVLHHSNEYTIVSFGNDADDSWTYMMSNMDNSEDSKHDVDVDGTSYSWEGVFQLLKN
ncbi:MAG: heparinase II/III family protein [Cyclobacteriaceae bacterium]